jgi:3-dehydroquinate dehydratase type I
MSSAGKFCGCLMNVEPQHLLTLLQNPEVDLLEWRLDAFIAHQGWPKTREMLALLGSDRRRPILVTNRPERQGGMFVGSEAERLAVLEEAVEAGADWVDLEDDVGTPVRRRFHELGARVLVSHHDFSQTPGPGELQAVTRELAVDADCIKIVTFANNPEDCLRVLQLIPWGRETLGVDVIAFCMGATGRWSRVVSLLLGSPWTYVSLQAGLEAAPGQYSVTEIRTLLEMLT